MSQFPMDEDFLRSTIEGLPIGLLLASPDGRLLVTNEALTEVLGYDAATLRSMTYRDLGHPDEDAENRRNFERLVSGEVRIVRKVTRLVCADGSVVVGDMSTVLLRHEDGTPKHFVAQVLDVTEHHESLGELAAAIDELDQERRSIQAVFDSVDVGLLLIDRDGHYERMNRTHAETMMLPFPDGHEGRAGQLGKVFRPDRVTPMTREEMPSYRAAAGEEFDDLRYWVGSDPLTRRAYSTSARTVRNACGEMTGAALAYKDITDLMRAMQVKDEFVASVSHELRTPLTSVLGYLEMLGERTDLPDDAKRQVGVIERSALRLRALVSDLLHAAQAREGGVQLVRSETDVCALVREAVEAARPAARHAGVELATELPDRLVVVVDAHRIRQVLDNLVSNAIKYSDVGGRASVRLSQEGIRLEVAVSDTGIGIGPAEQERLFSRFFRGAQAQERQAPGTGLGLSIVRDIAEAHGGEVRVRSELGVGSTFTLSIPCVQPDD